MSANKIKNLWSNVLIKKDIKSILSLYSKNFVFKGTYMQSPTKDRKILKEYFDIFSPKVENVVFLNDNISLKKGDIVTEIGSYKFYTTEGIVGAQYNFVYSTKDKKILSHFSTLKN